MTKHKFIVTSNAGLEDITSQEIEKINGRIINIFRARVFVESDLNFVFRANYLMRSAHKIILVLLEQKGVNSLDDAYTLVYNFPIEDFIGVDQTFAVRFERTGEHEFTSLDLNAKVGAAIIDRFKSVKNQRIHVNLSEPEVEFIGWLNDDYFIFGINTSGESLHKRRYRQAKHVAPLKSTIAYSLLQLSKWPENMEQILVDPMCGSGTILIEAAHLAKDIPPGFFREDYKYNSLRFLDFNYLDELKEEVNKKIQWNRKVPLYGVEINEKFYKGALENIKFAKVEDTIKIYNGDATKIRSILNGEPEIMIVNPPYGIRLGVRLKVEKLYEKFMEEISKIDSLHRVVIMTADKTMEDIGKKYFELKEKRTVLYGSFSTLIYTFTK